MVNIPEYYEVSETDSIDSDKFHYRVTLKDGVPTTIYVGDYPTRTFYLRQVGENYQTLLLIDDTAGGEGDECHNVITRQRLTVKDNLLISVLDYDEEDWYHCQEFQLELVEESSPIENETILETKKDVSFYLVHKFEPGVKQCHGVKDASGEWVRFAEQHREIKP